MPFLSRDVPADTVVQYRGRTYRPGDTYEYDGDPCSVLGFMQAAIDQVTAQHPDKRWALGISTEPWATLCRYSNLLSTSLDDLEQSLKVGSDALAGLPEQQLSDGQPTAEEAPHDLGAPTPPPVVEADPLSAVPDLEPPLDPPANLYHHPESPRSEGEIADILIDRGADPDDVIDLVDRARRGDAPPGQPHPFRSAPQTEEPAASAEPVDLFTGEYRLEAVDLELPGCRPEIRVVRSYASGRPAYGPLGFNWDHSFNVYLRELSDGGVAVWTGRLREEVYRLTAAGAFEPPIGVHALLEAERDLLGAVTAYRLRRRGGDVWTFSRPQGWAEPERIPMIEVADRHGNALRLMYDEASRLRWVDDGAGHGLEFAYRDGLLAALSDHSGRVVLYSYAPHVEHLVAVTSPPTSETPRGHTVRFGYDESRGHPALAHNIVQVFDSTGRAVVENEYGYDPSADDFNRVVRQYYLGEEYLYATHRLRYGPPVAQAINDASFQVTLNEPTSSLRVYTFNFRGDLLDERTRLRQDGSYRIWAMSYRYSTGGNRVLVRRPNGLALEFEWDEQASDPRDRGNLLRTRLLPPPTSVALPRTIWQLTYEPRFQLLSTATDEAGEITRYEYDYEVNPGSTGTGCLVRVEHPGATLPDGTVQAAEELFEYDAQGRLTKLTSAAGRVTTFTYSGAGPDEGRLKRMVAGDTTANYSEDFSYDTVGNLRRITLASGAAYELVTDALGRLVRATKPEINGRLGEVISEYAADGTLARQLVPGGDYTDAALSGGPITHEFHFDPLARTRTITYGANTSTPQTWSYQRTCSHTQTITDPLGRVTRLEYDERGLVLQEIQHAETAEEAVLRFRYDRNGNLVRFIDAEGREFRYRYDAWDRLVAETQPGAEPRTRTAYSYGVRDQLEATTVTGLPGPGMAPTALTSFTTFFDERGRSVTHSQGGRRAELWRDEDASIVRVVDERGKTLELSHDAMGRLSLVRDAMGNEVRYGYDADGHRVSTEETDVVPGAAPEVFLSQVQVDARGRPTAVIDPLGNSTTVQYDDRDLAVDVVTPLGLRQHYQYDLAGLVTGAQSQFGPTAAVSHRWTRDRGGRLSSYVDPLLRETRYVYGLAEEWTTITRPDGRVRRRRLNKAGQVLEETTESGNRVTHSYGGDGALMRLRFSSAPGVVPLADLSFVRDGLGRAVRLTQGSSSLELGYDSLGRLAREVANGMTSTWDYDDAAGSADLTYPDGRIDRYQFDALGRLAEITLMQPSANPLTGTLAAGTLLAAYDYCGQDRLFRRRGGNGCTTTFGYDGGRRLERVQHEDAAGAELAFVHCVYDAASRRRVIVAGPPPGVNRLLDYDDLGRLTAVTDGFVVPQPPVSATQADSDAFISGLGTPAGVQREYVLSPADARLRDSVTDAGGTTTRVYDHDPRYAITQVGTSGPGLGTSSTVVSNADGLRIDDPARSYRYDVLGRLREVSSGTGVLATMDYDPLGRLAETTALGVTSRRAHFGGRPTQVSDVAGLPMAQFAFGSHLGELIAMSDGANRWGHQDALLSLTALTDDAGAVLERYVYDPFGAAAITAPDGVTIKAASTVGPGPIFGTYLSLVGLGLYDARARTYDPHYGVFLQPDRRGATDSPNVYAYAAQDPVNAIDPSGDVLPIIAAFVIMGALGGAGYSFYDASEHPERYEGSFSWRTLGQVFGGALVGAAAGATAHAVATIGLGSAGAGGLGAAGGGASAGTLTTMQKFVLGGTMSAFSGYVWRTGFHGMFPEYADPPSVGNMTVDYLSGGLLGPVTLSNPGAMVRDQIPASFAPRAFGNNWKLILNPRTKYTVENLFRESRVGRKGFKLVSQQYWKGQADGKQLHHLWTMQSASLPKWLEPFRNSGLNLLEISKPLNHWMGGNLLRERSFRLAVAGVLAATGYGSYKATEDLYARMSRGEEGDASEPGDSIAPLTLEVEGVPGGVTATFDPQK